MMKRRLVLVALITACLLHVEAHADHLDENEIARGKPDTLLSGIDVYRSTIRQVIARLGQPSSATVFQEIPGSSTSGKEYEWSVGNLKLGAYTFNDKGEDSVPYSVNVDGQHPKGEIGCTGRGLKLGATLTDVKRVYGRRFWKGRRKNGTLQVTIQWEDETTLYVYFDKNDRVDGMELDAAIE